MMSGWNFIVPKVRYMYGRGPNMYGREWRAIALLQRIGAMVPFKTTARLEFSKWREAVAGQARMTGIFVYRSQSGEIGFRARQNHSSKLKG